MERLAILELRATRNWSLEQTAKRMLVTPTTVASWMGRLDEEGPAALVQMPELGFPQSSGHYLKGGYDVQNADQAKG